VWRLNFTDLQRHGSEMRRNFCFEHSPPSRAAFCDCNLAECSRSSNHISRRQRSPSSNAQLYFSPVCRRVLFLAAGWLNAEEFAIFLTRVCMQKALLHAAMSSILIYSGASAKVFICLASGTSKSTNCSPREMLTESATSLSQLTC
jgi:hypothetical protein